MHTYIRKHIYTYHCSTLHFIVLHIIAFTFIFTFTFTSQFTFTFTLHCITRHYIITLHYIHALHYITLHQIAVRTFQYITLHYTRYNTFIRSESDIALETSTGCASACEGENCPLPWKRPSCGSGKGLLCLRWRDPWPKQQGDQPVDPTAPQLDSPCLKPAPGTLLSTSVYGCSNWRGSSIWISHLHKLSLFLDGHSYGQAGGTHKCICGHEMLHCKTGLLTSSAQHDLTERNLEK